MQSTKKQKTNENLLATEINSHKKVEIIKDITVTSERKTFLR